jgi:predicted HTH domain antitoxin
MLNTVELKLELPSHLTKDEVQTLLAVKLFETGRMSLGQAARLSGFSKRAFIEILGRQQIPVVNYSPDELREELGL